MDGFVYRIDYVERQTTGGVVQLNAKAIELSDTDETTVRDYIAELLGSGNAEDIRLRRRLPTPDWEDVAL